MKSIWLNLPVKDIQKSKVFFNKIGFRENPTYEKAKHLANFHISETDFVMMLFPEESFKGFTQNEISDTGKGTEMLLNIDAQSKKEVDDMAVRVKNSGGNLC